MAISGLPPIHHNPAESKLKLLESVATPAAAAKNSTSKPGSHKQAELLSDADHVQISKLKARDTQVKQHEQAHLSASGGLNVSNATFTYQRGPNGINYRVAGEVRIDTSPARTPEQTLAKAEQIIDAALAPADPSAVDRAVAAKAQNMAQQARAEIARQAVEKTNQQADQVSNIARVYEKSDAIKNKIDTFV